MQKLGLVSTAHKPQRLDHTVSTRPEVPLCAQKPQYAFVLHRLSLSNIFPALHTVGSVRLVVSQDKMSQTGTQHSGTTVNNCADDALDFPDTQAVFVFNFVNKNRRCNPHKPALSESSESDTSTDSEFHLPTSPNEGIPVTSSEHPVACNVHVADCWNLALRPQTLVRPVNHYVEPPAPATESRKRKKPTAGATRSSTPSDESTDHQDRWLLQTPAQKRHRHVSVSGSSDIEIIEGPSRETQIRGHQVRMSSRPPSSGSSRTAVITVRRVRMVFFDNYLKQQV